MQRPALIVIDMVNDFLEKWDPTERRRLVGSINDLVGLMRQFGHPIIWVRQEISQFALTTRTEGFCASAFACPSVLEIAGGRA
jgi:nicotinamidase-related amidase